MADDVTGSFQMEMKQPAPFSVSGPVTGATFTTFSTKNFTPGGAESYALREALRQAAVLICLDVLSQDIGKAPLTLRKRLQNGTSKLVMPNEHPVAALFAMDPNDRHSWVDAMEMMILWHALTANSYAIVARSQGGDPIQIIPWQTSRVSERINPQSLETFYELQVNTLQERALYGGDRFIPERDMIHVRGRMLDGMSGFPTLVAAAKTFETGASLDDYRQHIFSEDGLLRGVFKKTQPGALPQEVYDRLKSQLRYVMTRYRGGLDPIVLEDGLEFQAVAADPRAQQLVEQFDAQVEATCRAFRVPPHRAGHLKAVKYENLGEMEKAYVSTVLHPLCRRHELRFDRALLTDRERKKLFIEIDRDALEITDTKAQTERIAKYVERGIITLDEARAEERYNPLPNKAGATRLIPANCVLVDDDNQVVVGKQDPANQDPEGADEAPEPATQTEPQPKLRLVGDD